jgi:hypothetical protein
MLSLSENKTAYVVFIAGSSKTNIYIAIIAREEEEGRKKKKAIKRE